MRKIGVVVAATVMAGGALFVSRAGATGTSSRNAVTVNIVGSETFHPNGEQSTYRFPDAPTKVAPGGTITFVNVTADGHAPAVVPVADLPTSFNCPDCNSVSGTFFPTNGPPGALSIQGGALDTDDVFGPNTYADPPTFSNAVALNPDGSLANGDAVLVDASGPNNGGGPTSVTVKVGAAGTYFYVCAFHPWMQGKIIVG